VGYRLAIGSLALILALGLCPLLRVPDVRYEETVDEFTPEDAASGVSLGTSDAADST
jgi:hypothetical protein